MPRVMEIMTPLGPDALLFHSMHAREEVGRIGECQLELLSLKTDIDLDCILGKNVTVKLLLQDDSIRYFNGFVTRFSAGGKYGRYRRYSADINTWAWFMSRTSDCRIFQEMTVPDIVKKVFGDHPTASFQEELTGSYRKWTYCVQYRETDLNFVCRLMEHEGIYFYFTHEEGKHTLVMADSYSAHAPCQDDPIPFISPEDLARPDIEHVSDWMLTRQIQPGVYAQNDYDFERPTVSLRTKKPVVRSYTQSDYEVFDYPGCYMQKGDGEQLASVRINEYAAQFETAQADTNAKTITVGGLFNLDKCPRADQNGEHLIVSATYDLEFSDYESMPDRGGSEYRCRFVAMPSKQEFRPRRLTPKPFMQGPQTAVVVGPAGDEIYTDKHGRIKVQFHWDRYGQRDENSSCWIRVSQTWAGKGWGSIVIPRIEQEVIVEFLEGDPDQPIVTGCVYNGSNPPPTSLPGAGVVSGLKSNTHKGKGYNEMTMDDTAGKEKITIHGQYDMNTTVQHDQTITVKTGNRSMTIAAGTLTDTVKGDASLSIQAGSRTVSVTGGDYSATASDAIVLHGKSQGVMVTGDAKGVGITGNGEGVAIVGNGKGVGITGNAEGVGIVGNGKGVGIEGNGEGVSIKGNPEFFAEGTSAATLKAPVVDIGDKEINITGTKITIAAGASSIVLDAGGVTIQGPLVKIN